MSLWPILWALKSAPVADAEERLILVTLAERAWADGSDALPSKKTVAKIAMIDPKTVQRRLRALEKRGLIAEGDQAAAAHIPEYFRPTVYDLMIPYSWFPDIDQVNEERTRRGKPALTPEDRPDLSDAPPRKQRADKGRSRRRAPKEGGSTSPQGEVFQSPGGSEHGVGSTSPRGGVYESQTRGLEDPQPSPSHPLLHPSPSLPTLELVPSAAEEQEGGGGGDASQQEEQNAAAATFVDRLPYRGRIPGPRQRDHLIDRVSAALAAGWTEWALRVQLTDETDSAKSLPAVYRHRLSPEELPAAPPLPAPRSGDQVPQQARKAKCPECHRPLRNSAKDALCNECRQAQAI